jgi:formate hydrogenlyase subunit 3/multisubunit Na+/H+ antiporter MnhD subunit
MVGLWCVAALVALAVTAVALRRKPIASTIVYAASLAICAVALVSALAHLIGAAGASTVLTLPLGLPWVGAHFEFDPLSTFFAVVVNVGGAAASIYTLGYGRHETAPSRVLPFFPVFLAGMNLVLLAADAFTFLFSWELMSLASRGAGDVASSRTRQCRGGISLSRDGELRHALAPPRLWLAGRPDGAYAFGALRGGVRSDATTALILILVLLGAGSKAGIVPLHA